MNKRDSSMIDSDADLLTQGRPTGTGADDRRARRSKALLVAIITILLLSLCAVAAILVRMAQPPASQVADKDESGGLEWIRSIYGWGSRVDEQFVRPVKVEIGANGDLLVTDLQYPFIMRFSPDGTLIETIGESAEPPLYRVGAVAEGDGQIFSGQSGEDVVRVFTFAGEEEGNLPFPSPNDIEFSGDRLAVASNWGFVVFDAAGEFLFEVGGERGEEDHQFDVISGLGFGPDGTLYVADAYNNRVSAYDEGGSRLWMQRTGVPPKGLDITQPAMISQEDTSAPAGLQMPVDVCVDGSGRVVVIDAMGFSIAVLDAADGSFIAKYGTNGTKDGQLMYPSSIDYDVERDWFVLTDSGNKRVQIVRIDGSSAGTGALAGMARRALAGPLRACIPPLILLAVLGLLWLIVCRRRQRLGTGDVAGELGDSDQAEADATSR